MKTNTLTKIATITIASAAIFALNISTASAELQPPGSPSPTPQFPNPGPYIAFECFDDLPADAKPHSWMFVMNFNAMHNAPRGCLVTVDKNGVTNKNSIDCKINGAVQISQGMATFGSVLNLGSQQIVTEGNIECPFELLKYLPDLPATVSYDNLDMRLKYQWLTDRFVSNFDNPIFSHPGFEYALPTKHALNEVALTTAVGGWSFSQKLVKATLNEDPDGWGARSKQYKTDDGKYQVAHTSRSYPDSANWGSGNSLRPGVIKLDTADTKIYLGKRVSGIEKLLGKLDFVMVTHLAE